MLGLANNCFLFHVKVVVEKISISLLYFVQRLKLWDGFRELLQRQSQ